MHACTLHVLSVRLTRVVAYRRYLHKQPPIRVKWVLNITFLIIRCVPTECWKYILKNSFLSCWKTTPNSYFLSHWAENHTPGTSIFFNFNPSSKGSSMVSDKNLSGKFYCSIAAERCDSVENFKKTWSLNQFQKCDVSISLCFNIRFQGSTLSKIAVSTVFIANKKLVENHSRAELKLAATLIAE